MSIEIITTEEAVKIYNSVWEYSRRMGQCGNCVHIRRTPKHIRPVRYYCLPASENMLDGEDREFTDDDIFYIKKTDGVCSIFEPNRWWIKQVENIFRLYCKE